MNKFLLNRIIEKNLQQIKESAVDMSKYKDSKFKTITRQLKKDYKENQNLNILLPKAFAAIAEVSNRVLGLYPYDTQFRGAIAMHYGCVIDMKAGEGKTLCAILPLYLNALTNRTVVLTTANNYLANRDANQMKKVFEMLGLKVSCGVSSTPGENFTVEEKQLIYKSDVVYTTHSTLVFDYLIDNLRTDSDSFYLKDLHYVILDEVDTILLDAAQAPLIISGAPDVQSNLFDICNDFVQILNKKQDYDLENDNRLCWLLDEGYAKINRFFNVENIFNEQHSELLRQITLALNANVLFHDQKDYIVLNNEVVLLDSIAERIMDLTKLNGGQHQAIETKEKVNLTKQTRAIASTTYHGFFSKFDKIAGMSGSIYVKRKEIYDLYGLKTVLIPTWKKCIRKEIPEQAFISRKDQIDAAIELLVKHHKQGQPVLAICDSIKLASFVSEELFKLNLSHNLLDAYNTAKEAKIISEAGTHNNITVATPMAGRGADIILDKAAVKAGGLVVIIVGKLGNKRLEIQSKGRCGRQGDPGVSYTLSSLEDEIMQDYGFALAQEAKKMNHVSDGVILNEINRYQQISEEKAEESREQAILLDEDLQAQKNEIYNIRKKILEDNWFNEKKLLQWTQELINNNLSKDSSPLGAKQFLMDYICYDWYLYKKEIYDESITNMKEVVYSICKKNIKRISKKFFKKKFFAEYYRLAILKAIDNAWIFEVDYLEQLRIAVHSRYVAQKDVKHEYRNEANNSFEKMLFYIREHTIKNFYLSEVVISDYNRIDMYLP